MTNPLRRSLSYNEVQTALEEWPKNQTQRQTDGILIDLSDGLSINSSTAQQIMTETHRSMTQIDWTEQTAEEPTYCNVPIESTQQPNDQNSKYYSPPNDSSNGSTTEQFFKPEDRYYSAVASSYEESQSQAFASLPSTQKYVWNADNELNSYDNSGQQLMTSRMDRAFDWLEPKLNEFRSTESPKRSIWENISHQNSSKNDLFNEIETKNTKTETKLSKEFIAELESKLIINPNIKSNKTNDICDSVPNAIPLIQPPPKYATTRRNNSGLTPTHPNGNSSDTTFATVCLPNRPPPQLTHNANTAHVKPFLVTPSAPSRETIYGLGVSHNSIPGASLPTNIEFPQSLVARLQSKVGNSSKEECISVLYKNNMDAVAALKELQISQLMKLGIASKYQCEQALNSSNYDLEMAASRLLDLLSAK